jgi:hypothetical protein
VALPRQRKAKPFCPPTPGLAVAGVFLRDKTLVVACALRITNGMCARRFSTDKLLGSRAAPVTDAGSPSPFRRHSDDTTPIQRNVTHDYMVRIREAMRRVMEELNVPPSEPHSGAVWAAAINLMYCSISLNEITPERIRAYDPLSPEAADRLDAIRAELDGLVAKLRSYLGKGAGGDLQHRLQQLGQTGDEIRLLSEIERIITAHGLVEFRGTLSMLLDRMESAAFEVGVFGRVSSGKSSLLNYILQTDVLPIGVTPVTAIPTRISHGPAAEAGIEFAEAQPRIISLFELPEFATEQKNPGNKKHVTRIFVKLPSDRLAEGGAPDELPKPAGMPMLDVNEISQKIVIEKPRILSLFGKNVLASQVRRKLESEYDRALLEFLSLYANRLRRWMEQSINSLRNAFNEFSDIHRTHFEGAPTPSDTSEIQKDLWILRELETADAMPHSGNCVCAVAG